jgi:hypothetical protein
MPILIHVAFPATVNGLALEEPRTCSGTVINYSSSMFSHYPWHLHDTDFLDYKLAYIDPDGRFFCARSKKCYGSLAGTGSVCEACNQIVLGRQLQELMKRAHPDSPVAPTLNIQFRTHPQVCNLLQERNAQFNTLQLKVHSIFLY